MSESGRPRALGWLSLPSSARKYVILGVICALGAGLAAFLFLETAHTEYSLSEAAFRGTFTSSMSDFAVFMTGQLRAIRAVADSLATHGSLPDFQTTSRIAREFDSLFTGEFAGIGVAARVPNTPQGIVAWEAYAETRFNRTLVRLYGEGAEADASDEHMWVIQDVTPLTQYSEPFVGFRLTSDPLIRPVFQQLAEDSVQNPPSNGVRESIALSGIISFVELPGEVGMMAFASIFDDDPTAYCVGAITTFDAIIEGVTNMSSYAVIQISDHMGGSRSGGGCTLEESDQVISQQVVLTSDVTWTISIGQCPEFQKAYVSWRRWVLLVITILMTLLSLSTAAFVMKYQDSLVQQALDRVRGEEKDRANQLVVGYICHELRNPLHIIKTSFQAVSAFSLQKSLSASAATGQWALHSATSRSSGLLGVPSSRTRGGSSGEGKDDISTASPGDEVEHLTEEELKSIISDANAALVQMQSTVNEVLDFRAMDSGMNSLKLNKEQIMVSSVVMPIVMRCRAFMPVGVGLQVCIADPKGIACVDKGRIAQIITNGLSNAGKFTAGGDVRVSVALIRKSQAMPVLSDKAAIRGKKCPRIRGRVKPPSQLQLLNIQKDHLVTSPSFLGDVDPDADDLYLSITISNPRSGPLISNTEDCFMPFKQKGGGGVWKPVKAPPEHVSSMFGMWECAMEKCRRVPCVTLPELRSHRSGAVKVTTGLGLPLSRGFAHASAGWLALDEGRGDGMTHLWCVVEATSPPRPPPSAATSLAPEDTVVQILPSPPPAAAPAPPTLISQRSFAAIDTKPHATTIPELDGESHLDNASTSAGPSPAHRRGHDLPLVPVPVVFSSLKLVFVDDDPANQRVGQRFLKSLGVQPVNLTILGDGAEALAFLQGTYVAVDATPTAQGSDTQHPPSTADIMFLDIRMPGKSGIEVMQEIGKSPPFPIIAMTGNVDKDSVEEYRSLGFAGCIGKPFDKRALKKAVEMALGRQWFCFVNEE